MGAFCQGRQYYVEYSVEILGDLQIPKPKHLEPVAVKNRIANSVVRLLLRLGVLTAIEFDYQPSGETDEIQVVATEGRLPADVESKAAHLAQMHPEPRLLRRERPPKLAGPADRVVPHPSDAKASPTLPTRGRDKTNEVSPLRSPQSVCR